MKKNNRLHYVQNIFMCTAIFQVQSVIIEAISKGSSTVITGIYTDRQSGLSLTTVHDQEWRWTGLLCGILCKLCIKQFLGYFLASFLYEVHTPLLCHLLSSVVVFFLYSGWAIVTSICPSSVVCCQHFWGSFWSTVQCLIPLFLLNCTQYLFKVWTVMHAVF